MNRICVALLLWFFTIARCLQASAEDRCPICSKPYGGKAYAITGSGLEEPVVICGDCLKLGTHCYICGLPVKDKLMRLADGRLLCEKDTKQAVLDPFEAKTIFDDVKRDLQSILSRSGSLPQTISLVLEAKERLDKSSPDLISAHDDRLLMGLTRSVQRSANEFEHTIYLLHGLTRDRMKAVAAHEYGHAWLHENVDRKLNREAVEGFCDWLAYKVTKEKNLPNETKGLLASDYSRGQLQAFIAAEEQKSFFHVIQWLKDGIDPEIDAKHLERLLALRKQSAGSTETLFSSATANPQFVPTNLVLKGLSGSRSRRFALINNCTLVLNEQSKVRLGESNVTVRCVAIDDDRVTIHVAGESTTRTLTLSASAKP